VNKASCIQFGIILKVNQLQAQTVFTTR